MRILLNEIQREWATRLYHAIFMAIIFIIVGYFTPKIWYKWIDKTPYLTVDLVVYDKKIFKPCDIAIATTHYNSSVDTNIEFRLRVNEVKPDGKISPVPGSENTIKTFVAKTPPQGVTLISRSKVPCDYEPGIYFAEGVVTYFVKGEPRTTPYRGTTVTITERESE